ncbi:MAG: nicotinate-nucleotide adenylyltransferase [Lachnospiraceae bacterium]|nr:nicotinate-nucleotide adenylyltransferase [Lachnospiraceae bacterium]
MDCKEKKESENNLKKIGIMGGTFDPIHMAHLLLAEQARVQFDLDQVLFMPSSQPPHKNNSQISSVTHRKAMVLMAIKNNPYFAYSDMEILRTGTTYTSDTLKELHIKYPNTEIYFIMGADSLFAVDSWHQPERIFERTTILAGNRLDVPDEKIEAQICYLKKRFGGRIDLIDMPDIAISSSEIRKRYGKGLSIRYYVPEAVYSYIKEHQLYVQTGL